MSKPVYQKSALSPRHRDACTQKFRYAAHVVYFCIIILSGGATVKADTNTVGVELDALPYITGGYYLSGLVGINGFRLRAVSASTTVPDFAVQQGFKDNKIDAFALIVDYFPYEKYSGLWYGLGMEYWKQRIRDTTASGEGKLQNTVATIGVGYVWYFHQHFYLNPWAAVHALVSGTDSIQVGTSRYQPPRLYPEASLKFGIAF